MRKLTDIFNLSLELAKAEFKVRNEGSYLGILWYLLNPALTFLLLLAVFQDRLGQDIPSYPLYLLLGILMFNFFQQATVESTKIVSMNSGIMTSIKFPLEALPFSIILKTIFSHAFEVVVVVVFLLCYGLPATSVLLYPLLLCFLAVFTYGICLLFFAISVYFKDLDNVWNFVARLLWLATPIFYSVGGQKRLLFMNLFNPLYYFITVARDIIVYLRLPQGSMVIGMVLYSFLSLFTGLYVFHKLRCKLAELV